MMTKRFTAASLAVIALAAAPIAAGAQSEPVEPDAEAAAIDRRELEAAIDRAAARAERLYEDGVFTGEIGTAYVFDDDFNTLGVQGRLSYETNLPEALGALSPLVDSISYQADAFLGLTEDEETLGGQKVDSRTQYVIAAAAAAHKRVSGRLDGFVRVGVSVARQTVDVPVGTGSRFEVTAGDTDVGVLAGVGARYKLTEKTHIRTDLTFQNDVVMLGAGFGVQF